MICIIPQHGRSTRLPGKAMRDFCGLPLIAWAVIQAKSAHCVTDVYVSTESEEIAEICEPFGAGIIWRPGWMNDKRFSANVPIQHALIELGYQGRKEGILMMLATNPLKKPEDIDRLYATYQAAPPAPSGLLKQALLACETQEAVVSKQHHPYQGMKRGRWVYCDKSHKTLAIMGGVPITDAAEYLIANDRLMWAQNSNNITDEVADEDIVMHSFISGAGIFYYTDCDLWQTLEIDDEQGFEICAALMESQILKGKKAEVYYEYARSK